MINDDFYFRLENKFRGSRSEIKKRLSIYLPIIEPLKTISSQGIAIDLGCGRGEWIEILQENEWNVQGVDNSKRMIEKCLSLGLPVIQSDVIEYIRSVKSGSVPLVTAFHIAEHLPFDSLQVILVEAQRILLPGGLLIVETPNPENNILKARNFYLDPSHRNPLPPELLQFMAGDSGYSRSVIFRLNGPQEPQNDSSLSQQVFWALAANPDYALVAQKKPDPGMTEFLEIERLSTEPVDGIAILEEAIVRYEREMEETKSELNDKKNEFDELLTIREAEHNKLEVSLKQKEEELQQSNALLIAKEAERKKLKVTLKKTKEELQHSNALQIAMEGEHKKLEVLLNKTEEELHHSNALQIAMEGERKKLEVTLKKTEEELQQSNALLIEEEAEYKKLEIALSKVEGERQQSNALLFAKEAESQLLEERVNGFRTSHSWVITLPLRETHDFYRYISGYAKRVIKRILSILIPNFNKHTSSNHHNIMKNEESTDRLPKRARKIYRDLHAAIEENKGKN